MPTLRHHFAACICLLMIMCAGCSYFQPKGNKDDYLSNYQAFMQDVQSNYNIYDSKEWNDKDEKIVQFSQVQYRQFEGELSFHEKLTVGKYPVLYHLCKYKYVVQKQIDENYRPDTQKLVESLTEIMDTTFGVFKGYDRNMRQMLLDFKREHNGRAGSILPPNNDTQPAPASTARKK